LKVFYLIPRYENGYVFSLWCDKPEIIDFSKIQFDKDKDGCIRAFYKNYDKHFEFTEVKGKLFDFVKSKEGVRINDSDIKLYFQAFHKYNFPLWDNWKDLSRLRLLIITFLSIEDNTVYGYEYDNYKSLIHHIFHNYYNVYWIVYEYMKQRNLLDKILSIDHKGTLKKDINFFLEDNNYFKETKYNKIIEYLFESFVLGE
jgi:hypothetical protein